MRVSREQAAENRRRVVETASRLFRERGFDGIGVADLMKGAGLTHGGFYGQFASKEELMAQACSQALEESLGRWQARIAEAGEEGLSAVAAAYLSAAHRDHPGLGCALVALGAEAPRHAPGVRHALTEGLRPLLDLLGSLLPGRSKAVRRRKALATFSAMVGAQVLARAVDDPALSEEILQAVLASIEGAGRGGEPARAG
ncbi:TetR/AcrR family transcriptional regulator [Azotobacter chroococcum]|uniref:Transcriptional regulator, TetR family n=1 Tax=Azotobacter chroococcum NCIMB 8003 TaxID=1328314 RepID=A0A0C4WJD4_9GAMM|nr:TetR/AcrR family transcriptional regulator [Azotobacter chroococcum]AJE20034.1 Transcriptional regulator, TetR family [Azotobacter chroococcum NCIMB 8003]MEE4461069.1 TetR/AcrR family transcriptional regulator [Azotobacter chroococcum]